MSANILIVEDEAIIAMDLKNQLLGYGYGVADIALSSEDALRKAEAHNPDLVLMDIMLKGKSDGIQTAHQLSEHFDIPVVFLSAYSDKNTLARVKAVGAHGYLVKPFRSEELHTTIEVALVKYALTKKLKLSEERVRTTLASLGDAVVAIDAHGHVEFLNPVAESLTGWTNQEARGLDFDTVLELLDDSSGERIQNPLAEALSTGAGGTFPPRTVLKSKSGHRYPVEDACTPIVDHDGKITGAVVVFRDVSTQREMLDQITYQARHDALTGLVNRREFESRLEALFQNSQSSLEQHALLCLDLDRFKIVNDSCGHQAGDELLRRLSDLMTQRLRKSDLLARLGGDEFGILLENCPAAKAQEIAKLLIQDISSHRFSWQNRNFTVGACVGIVTFPATHQNVSALLIAADTACYLAKAKGGNREQVYRSDDEDVRHWQGQSNWVTKLGEALEHDQFCLYAQRIAPLQGKNGHFYELLLRLNDAAGSLIAPSTFLPAAERYNLMAGIDRWVIQHAAACLGQHNIKRDHCYAINLSGASLSDKTLLEFVTETLRSCQVSPSNLCFEITETVAVAQLQEARDLISSLKTLGCKFALDDFGSGLSSFRYLKHFPVDFLKIDGHFIKQLHEPLDYALIESVQRVAQVLGVKTVAEHVENKTLLSTLSELGVNYAQGYGLHEPEALERVLEAQATIS